MGIEKLSFSIRSINTIGIYRIYKKILYPNQFLFMNYKPKKVKIIV